MTEKRTISSKADLKVVMIGDASVGKTCLVLRYIDRQFQESICTIGASFVLKTWGHYNIAIWDTAGGERYTGMSTFYYRNASTAVLAFDITNRKSLESLSQVYLPILNNINSPKLKVIVGTKRDLIKWEKRQVLEEEGIELAKKLNPQIDPGSGIVPYFETSSKTGLNVDVMFEYIFQYFYPNGGSEPRPLFTKDNNILLTNNNETENKKNSYSCC